MTSLSHLHWVFFHVGPSQLSSENNCLHITEMNPVDNLNFAVHANVPCCHLIYIIVVYMFSITNSSPPAGCMRYYSCKAKSVYLWGPICWQHGQLVEQREDNSVMQRLELLMWKNTHHIDPVFWLVLTLINNIYSVTKNTFIFPSAGVQKSVRHLFCSFSCLASFVYKFPLWSCLKQRY